MKPNPCWVNEIFRGNYGLVFPGLDFCSKRIKGLIQAYILAEIVRKPCELGWVYGYFGLRLSKTNLYFKPNSNVQNQNNLSNIRLFLKKLD